MRHWRIMRTPPKKPLRAAVNLDPALTQRPFLAHSPPVAGHWARPYYSVEALPFVAAFFRGYGRALFFLSGQAFQKFITNTIHISGAHGNQYRAGLYFILQKILYFIQIYRP